MSKYQAKTINGKMMLISRDIQVGDRCINILNFAETTITEERQLNFLAPKTGILVKKVGEISPDALSYVKEGQEFDEDDVKVIYPNFHTYMGTNMKALNFIKVKGSCGHFH